MGGRGSGRLYRWSIATTIEEVRRLDIRYLHRKGLLVPGYRGRLSWSRGDEPTGSISFSVARHHVQLDFRVRHSGGGDWESVTQTVLLDRTPCHFGGVRSWFLCPRCRRRVAVLCGLSTYFWCRNCYQLPYGSQRESYSDRMTRKARKIRSRLRADPDLTEPIWEKPKGMHWRTFERLREAEAIANDASWGVWSASSRLFELD